MKIRAVLEVDVPEEVAEITRAQQAEMKARGERFTFSQHVDVAGGYSYRIEADFEWEVEPEPDEPLPGRETEEE